MVFTGQKRIMIVLKTGRWIEILLKMYLYRVTIHAIWASGILFTVKYDNILEQDHLRGVSLLKELETLKSLKAKRAYCV